MPIKNHNMLINHTLDLVFDEQYFLNAKTQDLLIF